MYPLERTHPLRRDLDWLPPHLKAYRWLASGAIGAGIAGGCLAAAVLVPGGVFALPKLLIVSGAGGAWLGDRAGRSLVRDKVQAMARGEVDLARLQAETDGELVIVRGRVRATQTLPSVLHGLPAVYRRLTFEARGRRMVHEAAVDFDLVDEGGERIAVQVRDARLIIPPIDLADYPGRIFAGPQGSLAEVVAQRGLANRATIAAAEQLVREGDLLQLVGYKTRTVDASVHNRLDRETPMRAALRSGRALPLLLYKDPPLPGR